MKKFFCFILFCLTLPIFTACEISNTDLANSLEGNMTRLVYSIGYLDCISTEDLSNIVNNSSYFTHSSLYTGTPLDSSATAKALGSDITDSSTTTTANGLEGGLMNNATNGSLNDTTNSINKFNDLTGVANSTLNLKNSTYRSRTYTSPIINTSATDDGTNSTKQIGTVDMSLLETSASDLNNILREISSKRGIIMLYCTDLRSGRASLSLADKQALAEYDDIIKETTNYLNNNTGALTNYFNNISSISTTENSAELINAKLIRANEVLKTRYAKLDTCLDSLDAIINILINNIGYDYSLMYNTPQTTSDSSINSTITESQTVNPIDKTTVSETETNHITTTPSTITNNQTGYNNTNSCCPSTTNNTTNNCCPSNNIPLENNSYSSNASIDNMSNNSCCYPSKNPVSTKTNNDNTIINYNYDEQNTSNILLPQTTPNNMLTSPTVPTAQSEINTQVSSLSSTPNITNNTANGLTDTEIALNGGLVKHSNIEKIPANHIDSVVANTNVPNAGSLTKDHKSDPAEQLKVARPLEKITHPFATLEETNKAVPIPYNLRDDEYVESEKDLTPDVLPFAGAPTTNSVDSRPLSSPELGIISFLPFQYEEENVLKKLPRQ